MAKDKPGAEKTASTNQPVYQTFGIMADIAMIIEKSGDQGPGND